ncbi:divergent PAP2 family protein [Buttiauxella sp. WJP83]|uniref:divergent PAP2 family protein n=1 Tax=Buttiauxella sp. WJP83 TaxID=2986951 RepID=UPI0022DD9ED1|nr:divergent PAP2 family protein [Buttiauxella sp. WJP83]WBM69115.1 divergent PAP2 family protein [Buttiauxella sp. WJP83]
MDFSYAITPFLSWFFAGGLKFFINSLKERKPAYELIGYGGMPSNHAAIVSSMVALIAMKNGVEHPSFGVALTLAFIVILDANSLRRNIGKIAKSVNKLAQDDSAHIALRERMGHTKGELAGGVLVGTVIAWFVSYFF